MSRIIIFVPVLFTVLLLASTVVAAEDVCTETIAGETCPTTEAVAWEPTCAEVVVIPHGVTSIGENAFRDCSTLTSVVIPTSVKTIGSYAFYACRSLTTIVIPNSVTNMGDNVFAKCKLLTSIAIPDSVTSIGRYTLNHNKKRSSKPTANKRSPKVGLENKITNELLRRMKEFGNSCGVQFKIWIIWFQHQNFSMPSMDGMDAELVSGCFILLLLCCSCLLCMCRCRKACAVVLIVCFVTSFFTMKNFSMPSMDGMDAELVSGCFILLLLCCSCLLCMCRCRKACAVVLIVCFVTSFFTMKNVFNLKLNKFENVFNLKLMESWFPQVMPVMPSMDAELVSSCVFLLLGACVCLCTCTWCASSKRDLRLAGIDDVLNHRY